VQASQNDVSYIRLARIVSTQAASPSRVGSTVAPPLWCFDQYLPDEAARELPDFAPAVAQDLSVLPPNFIITAEHDLITVQALAYGRKLAAEGVEVRFSDHAGMIHGFLTLEPFFGGAAGVAMGEIRDFITQHAPQCLP
jgi:acetyl esterase/lipase